MSEYDLVTDFVKKEQELLSTMGIDIDIPKIDDFTSNCEILSGEKEVKNGCKEEIKEEIMEAFKDDSKEVFNEHAKEEGVDSKTSKCEDACLENEDLTGLSNSNLSTVTTPPLLEPEELIKWKAERTERLEKKDADEATKVAELKQMATIELKKWYADRDVAIEVTKAENRQRELEHESLMKKEEQTTEPDWDNIFKMCQLHSSKHGKERMKKLLTDIDHVSRA